MKNMNFVNTISPREHARIAHWYYATLCLVLLSMTGMLITHMHQLYTFYAVAAQQKKLASTAHSPDVIQKYRQLEQREQKLRTQLAELNRIAATMHNPSDQLTALKNGLAKNATLQICSMSHRTIDMVISCANVQSAATYIKAVGKECASLKEMHVTALQPNHGAKQLPFNATIRGALG